MWTMRRSRFCIAPDAVFSRADEKSRLGSRADAGDDWQYSGGAIETSLPFSWVLRGLSRRRGNFSDSDLTMLLDFFETRPFPLFLIMSWFEGTENRAYPTEKSRAYDAEKSKAYAAEKFPSGLIDASAPVA